MLAGAVLALAALGAVAWRFRARRTTKMMRSPAEAVAAAEAATTGLRAIDAVVSADGRGALVLGEDGRVLVVRLNGARPAARVVPWSALRQTPDGVVVETGERRFGSVALAGVTALDVRRLGLPPEADGSPA